MVRYDQDGEVQDPWVADYQQADQAAQNPAAATQAAAGAAGQTSYDAAWGASVAPPVSAQEPAATPGSTSASPAVGAQPAGRAASVIDDLGVAGFGKFGDSGNDWNTIQDVAPTTAAPSAGSPAVTTQPAGRTADPSLPDYTPAVAAVQNAPDPQAYLTAQDQLARRVASDLQAAGHEVSWQGQTLMVDGRPYEVGGSGWGTSPAAAQGAVTSDSDPRLTNPAYASDPWVLDFINHGQGVNTVNGPASAATSTPAVTRNFSQPTPFFGFNSLEAAAARGGLKDQVQLLLNGVDPNDWAAVKAALAPLGNQITIDDVNQNIDLTADRGGYVGVRSQNRDNPQPGDKAFGWMAYNDAVPPQGGFQPGDINSSDPNTGDALTGRVGPPTGPSLSTGTPSSRPTGVPAVPGPTTSASPPPYTPDTPAPSLIGSSPYEGITPSGTTPEMSLIASSPYEGITPSATSYEAPTVPTGSAIPAATPYQPGATPAATEFQPPAAAPTAAPAATPYQPGAAPPTAATPGTPALPSTPAPVDLNAIWNSTAAQPGANSASFTPSAGDTYTPGALGDQNVPGFDYESLVRDATSGNPVQDATTGAVNKLLANPESLDRHTIDMMEAADAEQQQEAAQSEDQAAKRFGFQAGLHDSPWLASERAASTRAADQGIIANRRNIEIEAAKTNKGDQRAAAALGAQYQGQLSAQKQAAVNTAVSGAIAKAAETRDRFALNESLKSTAAQLNLSKDQLIEHFVTSQMDDLTRRYGINLGAAIDTAKLAEQSDEFKADLLFRVQSLAQQQQQFTSSQSQQERQFGANLGETQRMDTATLDQRATQFAATLGLDYAQLNQQEQGQIRQLAQQNAQFGASLGETQRMDTATLDQRATQFAATLGLDYAQLNQQEQAQIRQLAQQNTQFGATLGENQREFDTTTLQRAQELAAQHGLQWAQLSQQDRQFYAQLAQQDAQFGANLGLGYDQLNSNTLNQYWNGTTGG